jgi:hypothetical protein
MPDYAGQEQIVRQGHIQGGRTLASLLKIGMSTLSAAQLFRREGRFSLVVLKLQSLHAHPAGLFFLAWGTYWTFYIFHSYLMHHFSRHRPQPSLKSSASSLGPTYTFPSWRGTQCRIIEPAAKLVLGIYGVSWAFQHQFACLGLVKADCWCVVEGMLLQFIPD